MNAKEMWTTIDYDHLSEEGDEFPHEGDCILAEIDGQSFCVLDCVAVSQGDNTWKLEFYEQNGKLLHPNHRVTRWIDMQYIIPEED